MTRYRVEVIALTVSVIIAIVVGMMSASVVLTAIAFVILVAGSLLLYGIAEVIGEER